MLEMTGRLRSWYFVVRAEKFLAFTSRGVLYGESIEQNK